MNETTENLWKALAEYQPVKSKPIIWKLVYDIGTGKPIDLTTEEVEKTKDISYIVITRAQADLHPHLNPKIRIIDGKIVEREFKFIREEQPKKITVFPDAQGNIVTDDYNMLIINSNGTNRWKHE